jgi:prepilin-type N-terminal cleavage/methylation domain-containing protein
VISGSAKHNLPLPEGENSLRLPLPLGEGWGEGRRATNAAFTLVELAIVLVILGLLVGGVITGQNLIRAAELRAVTTELAHYQSAVMIFKEKYRALPGDMTNATLFWGAMTNCGVDNPSGTGTQTCNGNGNGQVNDASAASRTGEMFTFWQHLANAGLVEGQFSGISGSSSAANSVFGVNSPSSKMSNVGWYVRWRGIMEGTGDFWFAGDYGNMLAFGTTTVRPLNPQEAWNIDTKIDDGKPEEGKVVSWKWQAGTGTTHCSNTLTREYAVQNTGQRCSLRG